MIDKKVLMPNQVFLIKSVIKTAEIRKEFTIWMNEHQVKWMNDFKLLLIAKSWLKERTEIKIRC